MGFFSGGSSTQQSDSYSGLRGTGQFGNAASDTGTGYTFGLNTIKSRVGDMNPLGLNANGLTTAQNNAFATLGKQMFGNVSGSYAGRGFLSPDNINGVVGSALQQVAPQLMGQIYQNQMGNQSVMSDRFGALNNLLSTGSGLLGSESHSTAKTQSPGLGYNFLNSYLTTLGSGLGHPASFFSTNSSTGGGGGGGGMDIGGMFGGGGGGADAALL